MGEVATFVSSYPVTTLLVGDSPLTDFESEYFPQDQNYKQCPCCFYMIGFIFSRDFCSLSPQKTTNGVLGATGVPSAGYLPMQALQVALSLRIVESLQILRMKGPGAEILGVFSNNFVSLDVLYKIKNYRVSFVPDPNKTIDLFCKNQHLWAKLMGKIVLWRHPYNTWPENFTPWSKYMANRPPRGRFIQGLYKPTQGKCAIYFCPGFSNQVF